jgi:hypothetical protein
MPFAAKFSAEREAQGGNLHVKDFFGRRVSPIWRLKGSRKKTIDALFGL